MPLPVNAKNNEWQEGQGEDAFSRWQERSLGPGSRSGSWNAATETSERQEEDVWRERSEHMLEGWKRSEALRSASVAWKEWQESTVGKSDGSGWKDGAWKDWQREASYDDPTGGDAFSRWFEGSYGEYFDGTKPYEPQEYGHRAARGEGGEGGQGGSHACWWGEGGAGYPPEQPRKAGSHKPAVKMGGRLHKVVPRAGAEEEDGPRPRVPRPEADEAPVLAEGGDFGALMNTPSWNGLKRLCTSVIKGLSREKRLEAVLTVLEEMPKRGAPPNVFHYTAAISACTRKRAWMTALKLMGQMQECGIEPNAVTYNATISACAKSQQWQAALALLQRMATSTVQPDVISYNAAIDACCICSKWAASLQLLREMEERRVKPDLISYGATISACAKSAQWQEALGLLDVISHKGLTPNALVYGQTILACEKADKRDLTQELVLRQEEARKEEIARSLQE